MAENALNGYTWSFGDVVSTISGPGGVVSLGQGAGIAAEGLTVTYTEEKDTMTTGADGNVQHSLRAGQSGRISIRVQRASPTNQALSNLYNFQRQFSANWGQNNISVGNAVSGDQQVGTAMAFVKLPDVQYATEAGMIEWEFQGIVETALGAGIAGLASAPLG